MDCHSVEGQSPVSVTPNYGIKNRLFPNMATSFINFFFTKRPPHIARIGLWTLSPRWSAVSHPKSRDFRSPEPKIHFPDWSAVFPFKSRDSRSPEPAMLFPDGSAVSHHKSRDFRFRWRHFRSRDFWLSPPSLWSAVSVARGNPTTNQMPPALDQSEASYLGQMGPTYCFRI